MIGLAGSHRVGKTTLAKAYSEKYEIPACITKTSSVFAELGYSPQINYPFDIKMTIQESILNALTKQYVDIGERVFIADRTPIDMLAYTLSEINREPLTDTQEERLSEYVRKCFAACNKHFSTLVIVLPGIELVPDPTKAPIGSGYIEHLVQLIMGLTADERVTASRSYIPSRVINLEERILCVEHSVNTAIGEALISAGGYAIVH